MPKNKEIYNNNARQSESPSNEKCGVYKLRSNGALENVIDHKLIVNKELLDDINTLIRNFIKTEKNKQGEYQYSSGSISYARTKISRY